MITTSTVANGSMLNRDGYEDVDVIKNREKWLTSLGVALDQTTRVNVQYEQDCDYLTYRSVGPADLGAGMRNANVAIADALVTTTPDQALFLPLADCVGAVLYDPTHGVLMLAHLGRHSLEKNGGQKIVEHLTEHYGSRPGDLLVWLTPAPSKASYPIWALEGKGMKEATFEQLLATGILPANITDNPAETDHDQRYFSHSEYLAGRRQTDGRYAVVTKL